MSSDIPRSAHSEMDSREALAREFFAVTHSELIPFVSDEATWYDFDYLDQEEFTAALKSRYDLKVNGVMLTQPFWKLLDLLNESRRNVE